MDAEPVQTAVNEAAPKWRPLSSRQRRVLGVLVEKAKTTPDAYPMSVNGLVAGCNQKSNREPQMSLSEEDVEQVLEELRHLGAVAEVQSTGRVPKYRHYAYEWLGVDKFEIAVMTELLLRGEQTLGELRQRASRMESIADLGALSSIVRNLVGKGLMLELTPEGRGQIVTHALYKERELAELRARFSGPRAEPTAGGQPRAAPRESGGPEPGGPTFEDSRQAASGVTADMFAELSVEVAELRAEVGRMRIQLRELEEKLA